MTSIVTRAATLAAGLFVASISWAQTPTQIPNSSFVANSNLHYGSVDWSDAAMNDQSRVMVVWSGSESHGDDTEARSIQSRFFNDQGDAVGLEFQVNTFTSSNQSRSGVAALGNGEFIVIWNSAGSFETDTSGWSIQARHYDSGASPVGDQFQVNDVTAAGQWDPRVAASVSQGFIVVWRSETSGGDDDDTSIQARLFKSQGSPRRTQFQVNTYTTGHQANPAIDVGRDGRFVVVWTSQGSGGTDSDGLSIQAQRFDSDGSFLGAQFQVNDSAFDTQWEPSVAVTSGGVFLISWTDSGGSGTGNSEAKARFFSPEGLAIGSELSLQEFTDDNDRARAVQVIAGPQADFVVSWEYSYRVGDDYNFYTGQRWKGRRYDRSGSEVGEEFWIASAGGILLPISFCSREMDANSKGELVVVWTRPSDYCSLSSEVLGKRYSIVESNIFSDGFESGDASAWLEGK